MLTDLYPRAADRYRSLPVLGPLVDGFAQSLEEQGYRRGSRRLMIRALRQIAELLQRCGCHQLPALTREGLRACAPTDSQADRVLAGTVHALERYLDQVGALPVPSPEPPTPTGVLLVATWGYALQRPIGAPYYWRAACWVVLGASLVTIIPAALAGAAAVVMVAVLLPLVVPAFVASFLYAYRSPQVWAGRASGT